MSVFGSQLGNFIMDLVNGVMGFFDALGAVFGAILDQIFAPIWQILYYLFIGIAQIADFAQEVFRKVAGLDTIYLGGSAVGGASSGVAQNSGGLVIAFLTHNTVYKMLIAIIIFSVVLLFLTTIIAIIKSEFAIDVKGSAKGPIIGRALKSLTMFFIVPIVTVLGIYLTNIITLAADKLLSNGQDRNLVNRCFYVGAYNANRGRMNAEVAGYWSRGLGGGGWTPDRVDNAFMGGGEKMPVINIKKDGSDALNVGAFGMVDSIVSGAGGAAAAITPWAMVAPGVMGLIKLGMIGFAGDQRIEGALVGNMHAMLMPMPSAGLGLTFYNYYQVNYFYSMSNFDYVLSIGTALVMAWLLLSTCLTLLKRVFEITMLMLLAPPMIALAPLDNGQAQKKWTGEMLKRVIAVIGPVFAFNMYFLLVPIFDSITLFGSYVSISSTLSVGAAQMGMPFLAVAATAIIAYNIFFQLITVITGLIIVKQASALISALLGVEDLVKSGLDASKKAVAVGAQAVTMAIGGAGLAVKGASAMFKAGKGASKAFNAMRRKGQVGDLDKDAASKKDAMDVAAKDRDDAQTALDNAEAELEVFDHMAIPNSKKGRDKYLKDRADAQKKRDDAKAALEGKQKDLDGKEKAYKSAQRDAEMWHQGASDKDIEKVHTREASAKSRDEAIKKAKEDFEKSAGTESDQWAMDDAIAKANRDYQRETGGLGGKISAGLGAAKSGVGNFVSRSFFGKAIAQEFGKDKSGTSIFSGSKHMDKSSQMMFRMILDNWVGMMGGKEDGAGLIVRRALEKTERERFFYAGKENKQLELKREQGLLMAERAKSEENMRKDAEKNKEKDLLRTMLQEQGLNGKELEEAFFNAWTRIQQGKGVAGFDEYKKRDEQKSKEDSRKKAISDKIEAHNVDVDAQKQINKAEKQQEVKGKLGIDSNSINQIVSGLKEAYATASKSGNTKLASDIKKALEDLNKNKESGDLKLLSDLVNAANNILNKIK